MIYITYILPSYILSLIYLHLLWLASAEIFRVRCTGSPGQPSVRRTCCRSPPEQYSMIMAHSLAVSSAWIKRTMKGCSYRKHATWRVKDVLIMEKVEDVAFLIYRIVCCLYEDIVFIWYIVCIRCIPYL